METFSKGLVEALKGIVYDCNWQNVGKVSDFKEMRCYRFLTFK